jgi:hypothetical protein
MHPTNMQDKFICNMVVSQQISYNKLIKIRKTIVKGGAKSKI